MAEPPRQQVRAAISRSIRWRWPMKLMRSMPGVPSATPAHESSASIGPPHSSSAASIELLLGQVDVDGLGAVEGDLGVVHDHDLGAGVLGQLGGGGAHAGGAADDEDALAVVAEGIEQAHVRFSWKGWCVWWIGGGHATTPRTLRSTMVSQSSPSSSRIASPCSLNSGARPAAAGSLVVLHGRRHQLERRAVGGLQSWR